MLVTITEYRNAAKGPDGQDWALGRKATFVAVQSLTAAGSVNLDQETRLVRVASDTVITADPNGAAELVQSSEWFNVLGGETITIAEVT